MDQWLGNGEVEEEGVFEMTGSNNHSRWCNGTCGYDEAAANATEAAPEDGSTGGTSGQQMSFALEIAWTLIFSAMISVAIAGNVVVMWIVTAHRRMWSATNSYIVSLSIADLLNSVFNSIFSFIFMKSG